MGYVLVHVTYDDGRAESLRIKPRAWLEVERRFGATVPPREGTMFAAWAQLHPGGDVATFDAWVDTLDEIRDEWVDPQKEATATPDGSPPSP